VHSPWQNGVAERWVGTCRRELLDHVIVLNEQHLQRLLQEFLRYYHTDRTHLSLGKDPPTTRAVCAPPSPLAAVASVPRVGGLHHRYEWRDAA
jgi:putative transposase